MGGCYHDPAADRRMDPQRSAACCCVLPDTGGLVGFMGRGHEGLLIVIVTVFDVDNTFE